MSETSTIIPPLPPPPEDPPPVDPPRRRRSSIAAPGRKLVGVAGLLLLLCLPSFLIADLIEEREQRQEEVQREIASGWGAPQTVLPPVLALPYRVPVPGGAPGTFTFRRETLTLAPATLKAQVTLDPASRRRGLFEAVVYTAHLQLEGRFTLPGNAVPNMPEAEILWDEAFVVAGSNELRMPNATPVFRWDGQNVAPGDVPLEGMNCVPQDSLRWRVALQRPTEPGRPVSFALALDLRGTRGFRLRPLAQSVDLTIASPWASPSFVGESPSLQEISDQGFRASWSANTRQPLPRNNFGSCIGDRGGIGVELLEAVPTYRMVNRASKYATFFLALAFVTYVLFELTARVRIHLVQYALLGCSVVLFPLLLLAIGEPLGFATAYAVSAAAVMVQASVYTASVTGRWGLATVFAGVLAALFGFLYVVLSLEAYALLVGTLALFAVLSVVMIATRRVAWGGPEETAEEAPAAVT